VPDSIPQDNLADESPEGRGKVIAAGVIGNLFEWYDFVIYGFFAPSIAVLFFGSGGDGSDVLKAFAVFAVGYFARPLGAIIFGSIGDRLGRKKALLFSLIVMAVPTIGLVFLPTWDTVGFLSPVLLILYRILQGISIGGEFTGANAYLSEHAGNNRRGLHGAMTVSSAMLGILLGSLVYTLMEWMLSPDDLLAWGWRLAFAGGLLILFCAAWLRWRMPVSPHFEKAKATGRVAQHPIRDCLRHQRGPLLRAIVLISFPAMFCYALTVYFSEFLSTQGTLPKPMAGLIVTVSIGVSVVLPLIIGAISDHMGRRPFIRGAFLVGVCWAVPMFLLAGMGAPAYAWIAALVASLVLGTMQGVYPATLTELFPTSTRYSGTSISYNVAFAFLGGTFPLIAQWLVDLTGSSLAPGYYLGAAGVIALILIWRIPETGLSPLRSD